MALVRKYPADRLTVERCGSVVQEAECAFLVSDPDQGAVLYAPN